MSNEIDRVKRSLEATFELGLAETPLTVIVMGPDLKSETPAAKLRHAILERAKLFGASVPPEHPELIRVSEKALGSGHHLLLFELQLVRAAELVVLIPESPGSLCELGFFSAQEDSGSKFVILVNQKYPRKGTYIAEGPLRAAAQHSARIHYVSYYDVDSAWRHVQARVQEVRAQKLLRTLLQS